MSSPSSRSISIHGGRETSGVTLHYLPCKVECDCAGDTSKDPSSERGRRPAEVDCYFEPVIREGSGTIRMGTESSQILTATFRGRPLKGVEIGVPEGYRGVILREQGTLSHDSQGREFVMRNHFDKIKLWNLQTCPTADDKLVQALTWTQIAQTGYLRISSQTSIVITITNRVERHPFIQKFYKSYDWLEYGTQ